MTTEDSGSLPTTHSSSEDPTVAAGLEIAQKWGSALGPDNLDVALRALEPELRRNHKERMARLTLQREAAQQAAQERQEERAHKRHIAGLCTGAGLAIAMLGAGVYVAQDAWWLAILLCGPSLLALAKVFVLRRSDAGDMAAVSVAGRSATNAAGQAQPLAPPPVV
ncbi:hypothetical protein [Streptomyces sp. NBC_01174]|uniref:hypothetical protein n=1 Tax=Streptomyces sp. NBC_01174 TaxID=2903758 RepID=UPI00386FC871|nr:hypothetical protein OG414_40705 [Streptomyces sp. NBC_01174]